GSEYVSGVKVQTPATRAKLAKLQAKDLTNLERRFNESAEKRANVIMDTISTGAKKGQPEYLELAQKLRTEFSDWQLGHNSELIGKIDGFLATAESDMGAAKDEVAAFRQERKDAMADRMAAYTAVHTEAAHTAAAEGMTFNPKAAVTSAAYDAVSFDRYQGQIARTVDFNKFSNDSNAKPDGYGARLTGLSRRIRIAQHIAVKPPKQGRARRTVAGVAAVVRLIPGGGFVVGRTPVAVQ
ncbi:MAG: hypothetical protein ACI9S8_001200, partial [Chlamydiales bacterium]